MKREIKFRVWCETDDGEEMIYLDTLTCDNGLWFGYQEKHINEHIAMMQYMGLKDKNGKDIYEGDVIRNSRGDWGVIVWKAPFFETTVSENQSSLYTREYYEESEIIGNIHENPELLKPTSESNTLPK